MRNIGVNFQKFEKKVKVFLVHPIREADFIKSASLIGMKKNAFDIETFLDESNSHIPFCICALINNEELEYYYTEGEDLILYALENMFDKFRCKNITVFVHNLNFDGCLIISSLSKQKKFKFNSFLRKMNLYTIIVEYGEQSVTFKCSYKLLPEGLKNIASSFNLKPKLIFPYKFASKEHLFYIGENPPSSYFNNLDDYETFLKYTKNQQVFNFREYSVLYCRRDVEITSLFVSHLEGLVSDFNINIDEIFSAPSLSLKIFQQNFNKNKISLRSNLLVERIVRPSYYGGKCEKYGNPDNKKFIFHFDFPGMYGLCMNERFAFGKNTFNTNFVDLTKPGFYNVIASSKNLYRPVLPHHRIKDGKLMFCNGEIRGSFWFEELLLHLKMGGTIEKINHGITTEFFDEVFIEFIDFFTKLRERGGMYKTFGKLMISSLYGRMGMGIIEEHSFFINSKNLREYLERIDILSICEINDIILINAEINHRLERTLKLDRTTTKSNIMIASQITSKARIKLYKAQTDIERYGGENYYTDTDSVIAGFDEDVSNKQIGEIFFDNKKKDTCIQDFICTGPKSYAILYKNGEEVVKIKGFKRNCISFSEFKEAYYSNRESIILRDQLSIQRKEMQVKSVITDKTFGLNTYDKRFCINKKETRAFDYDFKTNTYK